MSHKFVAFMMSVIFLSACTHTTQLTSGQDYLARYIPSTSASQTNTDLDVREIAAIEPDLQFPARIGLARIERGRLITVPADEGKNWADIAQNLGAGYGQFVPVSPMIASMVNPNHTAPSTKQLVDHIRRGSARQHLDYVLIYEVTDMSDSHSNALRVADLSVLGLFMLPTRDVKAEATASAMLIDVRNGYPYGTASSFADKRAISTAIGKHSKTRKLSDKARQVAVKELTGEVSKVMQELKAAETNIKMAER
jgi:hypothetical protein